MPEIIARNTVGIECQFRASSFRIEKSPDEEENACCVKVQSRIVKRLLVAKFYTCYVRPKNETPKNPEKKRNLEMQSLHDFFPLFLRTQTCSEPETGRLIDASFKFMSLKWMLSHQDARWRLHDQLTV